MIVVTRITQTSMYVAGLNGSTVFPATNFLAVLTLSAA